MRLQSYLTSITIIAMAGLNACISLPGKPSDLADVPIIPAPREVKSHNSYFAVNDKLRIFVKGDDAGVADFLAVAVEEQSGMKPPVEQTKEAGKGRHVMLAIDPEAGKGPEGYNLSIGEKQVLLKAAAPEGLFRGVQTIRQILFFSAADQNTRKEGMIFLPTGTISDSPEYEYRGAMLDVARHFFGPEVVKTYIDQLALYKINHLHLHLSDDQGWRIEIKSWPRLTEIGGSTEVGGGEGGYYTQEEYKDIVAYAAERFVTIVPEIDMPGHTNAALASYAELNCNGKATELYTGTRVGFSTLCVHREITYEFVDDVVKEISEMTPGPYFHVGGDESHVTPLDDYIYFINRVRDIVRTHGKTMLGWDEISHADLDEGDVAQYWSSAENAKRAIEKGAKLLISPAKYCYLDMKYHPETKLGLNWAAYIEVDDAYKWKPTGLEEEISRENILGVESPLWGETIESLEDIQYLAFPRIIGHAEIGWSNQERLNWQDYRHRLAKHGTLLESMNINYYRSAFQVFDDHQDIGDCAIEGSLRYDPDKEAYLISGSGDNIWFDTDQFHYGWINTDEDLAIRTKIEFLGVGVNMHRKAGIMFRGNTSTDAPHVSATIHAGDGLTSLQYRTAKGADIAEEKSLAIGPAYIQFTKKGNEYELITAGAEGIIDTVAYSTNALKEDFLAGIFICSHDNNVLESALFSHLELYTPGEEKDDFTTYLDRVME